MSEKRIEYGKSGGVATLTLARENSRNALDRAMCEALIAHLADAAADDEVRLVLIRARGPVFCAGADLKERQGMSEDEVRARRLRAFSAYHRIERMPKPIVAVVEGPAIGSGCEIAAACDFIFATPKATFSTPEALWGTVGATQRLPRIIGKRLAKDMMLTGRKLTADDALTAGLVTRVIEPEHLEAAVAEISATIIKAPPDALAAAKRCIDTGIELDPAGALAVELMAIEDNLAKADWLARMSTFKGGE